MRSAKKINVPLKVRDMIFRDILNGIWAEDNILPGTAELATRYNVGFCSVAEAVKMLGKEGIIVRHNGRRARISRGAHRRWRIGILVDNVANPFFPFDYNCAPTTWLKFNAAQLALIDAGYASLSMPPDLNFGTYLEHLDGAVVLRDTDGDWRFDAQDNHLPAVYCFNQRPDDCPDWYNYLDWQPAMEKAATTMIARGAKNIYSVSPRLLKKMFLHFQDMLEKYPSVSFEQIEFEHLVDENIMRKLAVDLLDKVKFPCGFIITGDALGWALAEEAAKRNLVLKKDISIIGTAGLPESKNKNPALSVIEVPHDEQAAAAVRQLGILLHGSTENNEKIKRMKVDVKLSLRDT